VLKINFELIDFKKALLATYMFVLPQPLSPMTIIFRERSNDVACSAVIVTCAVNGKNLFLLRKFYCFKCCAKLTATCDPTASKHKCLPH